MGTKAIIESDNICSGVMFLPIRPSLSENVRYVACLRTEHTAAQSKNASHR